MPSALQAQRVIYPAGTLTVGDTTPGGAEFALLLADGVSGLLLADGSSFLLLAQ